ncbi:hypothetical protein ADUPG1_013562 [Aduncisulcus paluster]|uniref:Uncharacterized protein n=1 Tax=Aduncisulcus paluster TaxID=2918883 RepID=A0ABQ5K3E9_9EUKA|nr:hypothetical protein ADUPG1_013562 [Aduncisulcus paluster]
MSIDFAPAACTVLNNSAEFSCPADSDQLVKWRTMANSIYIPFDEDRQLHPEYEGWDFDDPPHLINQDDACLLSYPLRYPMTDDVLINDLDYWTSVTNPDGYFTGDYYYGVSYAIVNEDDKRDEKFQKSFVHFTEPFGVFTEKAETLGHTTFLTGNGGYLQMVMNGYFGIQSTNTTFILDINQSPAPIWSSEASSVSSSPDANNTTKNDTDADYVKDGGGSKNRTESTTVVSPLFGDSGTVTKATLSHVSWHSVSMTIKANFEDQVVRLSMDNDEDTHKLIACSSSNGCEQLEAGKDAQFELDTITIIKYRDK